MPGDDFDVVMQLRQPVFADLLKRLLDDPSTQTPSSASFIPRRLAGPPSPLEPLMMLWWDEPDVAFDDQGAVTLTLAVEGGARQVSLPGDSGRIGSLHGSVHARARPGIRIEQGVPLLGLTPEGDLDLRGLRVKYADANPLPLVGVGAAAAQPLADVIAAALARDLLASDMLRSALGGLMSALARLPFSYATPAFGIEQAGARASLRVFGPKAGDSVTIGMLLPSMTGDAAQLPNTLATHKDSNVALTLTSLSLTAMLAQLLASSQIPRELRAPDGTELARIDTLGLRVREGGVTLVAHVLAAGASATVEADLALAFDAQQSRLTATASPTRVEPDTVGQRGPADASALAALETLPARLAPNTWVALLGAALGSPLREGVIQPVLRLSVPGTGVSLAVPANALEVSNGALTLYGAIPTTTAFRPAKPSKQPAITIEQHEMPVQTAPGALVTATVTATRSHETYAPYDHAWSVLPSTHLLPVHADRITVTGMPTGAAGDPEIVGRARVVVIDSFGQVARAEASVRAHPAQHKPKPKVQRALRAGLAAAIIVVLSGLGVAYANGFGNGGFGGLFGGSATATATPSPTATNTPPVPVVNVSVVTNPKAQPPTSPTTLNQSCNQFDQSNPVQPFGIVLDAGQSAVPANYTITITDGGPNGQPPVWATARPTSGSVPAGQTERVTIVPNQSLCANMPPGTPTTNYHIVVTYGSTDVTIIDTISPQVIG